MNMKELQRTATVAWSPVPQAPTLFATGTVAGAVDGSVQAHHRLEFLSWVVV